MAGVGKMPAADVDKVSPVKAEQGGILVKMLEPHRASEEGMGTPIPCFWNTLRIMCLESDAW
jgi:hypothetical protein